MTNAPARIARLSTAVLVATAAFATLASAQDRDSRARDRGADFRWEKALPSGSLVRIHNINGDVSVSTSGTGRVEVLGIRRGGGRDAEQVRAEVVETRDGIVVCVLREDADDECDDRGYRARGGRDRGWRGDASMDLEIRVPSDVQVSANSVSGDVSVSGVRGEVSANSVSGDVRLERIRATSISAHSVSGDVDVSADALSGRGDLSFVTVSGDVTLALPDDIDADVSITTVSGELDSEFQMQLGGRMSRRHLEARIGRGGRRLDIKTVSGDVRLKSVRG